LGGKGGRRKSSWKRMTIIPIIVTWIREVMLKVICLAHFLSGYSTIDQKSYFLSIIDYVPGRDR
jgi:hypothetical protein